MKFSIKDFFSKCDQIRRKLRIWSHLLKKSITENFIFRAVQILLSTLWQINMFAHLFIGCSLTFDTSNKIGFIPGDRRNFDESFVIVPNNSFYPYTGDFCYPNFIPSIGELYVQDYPNNINSKVWIKDLQTNLINTSIIYNEVQRKMVNRKYPLHKIP